MPHVTSIADYRRRHPVAVAETPEEVLLTLSWSQCGRCGEHVCLEQGYHESTCDCRPPIKSRPPRLARKGLTALPRSVDGSQRPFTRRHA